MDVDALVTTNLALVGHLAREASARLPRHLDTDDLVGAGALALVQAAHSFDPGLGVPFARFATTRVRGAMIDQMRQRDWATRSVRSRARTLTTVTEELTRGLQRTPTEAELAAASGMSVAEVRQVAQSTDRASLLSLDPVAADDEGLGAALADAGPRPDEVLVAAERVGYLRDALAELPGRTRMVVTGYYLENRQLTELAEELGVTQSRASQLRAEGLELLREALSRLLTDDARAGAGGYGRDEPREVAEGPRDGTPDEARDGVRARRREAYVQAVAERSSVRQRADVQAYLDGMALRAPQGPGPRQYPPQHPPQDPAPREHAPTQTLRRASGAGVHPLGA